MLQVFGIARIGFCVTNLEGVVQAADRTYSDILRYDHISKGTLGINDLTLPEDLAPLSTVMAKVSKYETPILYRRQAICGDGEIIWIENRLPILHSATEKSFLVATREVSGPLESPPQSDMLFPPQTCAAYIADLATELSAMASASNLILTSEMLRFTSEIVEADAATLSTNLHAMAH